MEVIELNPSSQGNKIIIEGAKTITDQSAIHIIAHGNTKGFRLKNNQFISTKKNFLTYLKTLDQWEVQKQSGEAFCVLNSCRTGRDFINLKTGKVRPSFAKKASKIKNLTIIAPTERATFTKRGLKGIFIPKQHLVDQNSNWIKIDSKTGKKIKERTKNFAKWGVFRDGKVIATFSGDESPVNIIKKIKEKDKMKTERQKSIHKLLETPRDNIQTSEGEKKANERKQNNNNP